ncbi:MAG: hypothetical protein RSO15_09800 [Bacteroides sp.]|uniref:hypothetical protein n=1 Tax=Bacteroides sp. TaxID=29523 RepID=UPI002FC96344
MINNLSHYKMISMDWIEDYIQRLGIDKFCDFEKRVNLALDKLRPGRYYEISTSVQVADQELFIKFCCCYITQHPHYEMSDDYCRIYNKQ